MEYAVRSGLSSLFQSLLRELCFVGFAIKYVDSSEVSEVSRLQLRLVALGVDPFTNLGDSLGRVETFRVVRHRCGHEITPLLTKHGAY